jgi:hypothetical protein
LFLLDVSSGYPAKKGFMRLLKLSAFLIVFASINPVSAQSRTIGFSANPMTDMTTEQEFGPKSPSYYEKYYAIVKGQKVQGSPLLYTTWVEGSVTTADGRVFSGYKLKYDVFSQTIQFLSGKDSMEVNEEIRDFVLTVTADKIVTTSKFINANLYKKEKTIFYYEILLDEEKGQLLRTNKKVVAELNSGIPSYDGSKCFRPEIAYFFFDNATKKISKIRADGSNLPVLLHLSRESSAEVELMMTNYLPGQDMIAALKPFFKN